MLETEVDFFSGGQDSGEGSQSEKKRSDFMAKSRLPVTHMLPRMKPVKTYLYLTV